MYFITYISIQSITLYWQSFYAPNDGVSK